MDWASVFITATTSCFAAFLGAYFAFKFQNRVLEREKRDNNSRAAIDTIFTLIRMYNLVASFRRQFIEPVANDPLRFLNMRPADTVSEEFVLDWDRLTFLITTEHANLLPELSVLKSKFDVYLGALNRRTQIFESDVFPAIIKAKLKQGSYKVSEEEIEELLGHSTVVSLQTLTDEIVRLNGELESEIEMAMGDIRACTLNLQPDTKLPEFKVAELEKKEAKLTPRQIYGNLYR